jgi:hypothetical protein
VHLTLGILRKSQAFFYALAFSQLDGFAVPTPAQVTQTVRRTEQALWYIETKKQPACISNLMRVMRSDMTANCFQ